jgi:hypothetical protein
MSRRVLLTHLRDLSHIHSVDVREDYSVVLVRGFETPPGYTPRFIDIRIEIPEDYPASPPGLIPNHIYVPAELRLHGEEPEDFHPTSSPDGWAWWCFEKIDWDPCEDDLITLMELLRLTMSEQLKVNESRTEDIGSWLTRLLSG